MKVIKETRHKFSFEMKDKSTYGPFVILAESEKEARAKLKSHLEEMLDQVEEADRKEEKKVAANAPTPETLPPGE